MCVACCLLVASCSKSWSRIIWLLAIDRRYTSTQLNCFNLISDAAHDCMTTIKQGTLREMHPWILRALMLYSSLNEDSLLTYPLGFFEFFFCQSKCLWFLLIFPFFFVNLSTEKSYDKDDFQPSRHAAFLYSPLHGPQGLRGLIFSTYSESSNRKGSFLKSRRRYLFV